MDYLDTVNRMQAEGPALESASSAERRAVERFQNLLGDFKAPDFEDRIRDVYAEHAFFNDTLKTVRGVEEIEHYLLASAAAIDEGRVEFLDWVESDGNYYFRWVMTLRFKRFAGSEPQHSVGMTHIRFDAQGKVVLHQDFWDSSAGFFEHVPFLGGLLRSIKRRL